MPGWMVWYNPLSWRIRTARSPTSPPRQQRNNADQSPIPFTGFGEEYEDAPPPMPTDDDFCATCPKCGELIGFGETLCAECGYDGAADVEDEDDGAGVGFTSSTLPPRSRKRPARNWSTPEKDQRVEKLKLFPETAWKRLKACILVVDGGLTAKLACKKVKIHPAAFSKAHWVRQYKTHGPEHVLVADQRHKKARVVTPNTRKKIVELSDEKGKDSSGDIQTALRKHYEETGQEDHPLPSRRSIRTTKVQEGLKWSSSRPRFLVKTPWDARWRKQFAEVMLELRWRRYHKYFRYLDAKKFCIFDSSSGHTYDPDVDPNVAKREGFTDEEYEEWLAEAKEGRAPASKAKGKFPVFVYGALGIDFKSELYIFDKGTKLTGPLFKSIIDDHFLEPCISGTMTYKRFFLIMDNDIKHICIANRAHFDRNGSKIKRVIAPRRKADGSPDNFHGGTWGRTEAFDGFPMYSPDINAPIEKAWREVQTRVLNRITEINSREDHVRIIKEEWKGLEFHEVENPWGKWIGINAWCKKFANICQAVIDADGWDTEYM